MSKKPRPMAPKSAVLQVSSHLQRLGFRRSFRSKAGSLYFRLDGIPFELRVSDHQWSGYSRNRQLQVVNSFVIRDPVLNADMPLLATEIAIRFVAAARARAGIIGEA